MHSAFLLLLLLLALIKMSSVLFWLQKIPIDQQTRCSFNFITRLFVFLPQFLWQEVQGVPAAVLPPEGVPGPHEAPMRQTHWGNCSRCLILAALINMNNFTFFCFCFSFVSPEENPRAEGFCSSWASSYCSSRHHVLYFACFIFACVPNKYCQFWDTSALIFPLKSQLGHWVLSFSWRAACPAPDSPSFLFGSPRLVLALCCQAAARVPKIKADKPLADAADRPGEEERQILHSWLNASSLVLRVVTRPGSWRLIGNVTGISKAKVRGGGGAFKK